jgi:nucleoside-diphosphate-sugar epimerase
MRVLLTGAGGYTGRGVAQVLRTEHFVRGLDVRDSSGFVDEAVVGDIADLEICRRAVSGMEAIVLCHMAPRPDGYKAPPVAFDANVKGTANLYHAAVESRIARVVLVSTGGLLLKQPRATAVPGEGPYNFTGELYVLTKIMQECIARYYHDQHGVKTALLRPSWIVYDEDFRTKYGDRLEHYNPTLIDPRDVGYAALAALRLPDPGLEAFQLAQEDSEADLDAARGRLGWRARYTFGGLRRSGA